MDHLVHLEIETNPVLHGKCLILVFCVLYFLCSALFVNLKSPLYKYRKIL